MRLILTSRRCALPILAIAFSFPVLAGCTSIDYPAFSPTDPGLIEIVPARVAATVSLGKVSGVSCHKSLIPKDAASRDDAVAAMKAEAASVGATGIERVVDTSAGIRECGFYTGVKVRGLAFRTAD